MNIRDTLTYMTMIPMVFGILAGLIAMAIIGATSVAGVVIGLAEFMNGG